jgi:hypothetical protein
MDFDGEKKSPLSTVQRTVEKAALAGLNAWA